jgi:hypothetical protein
MSFPAGSLGINHSYSSRCDLLSTSLTMPQRTTSPVHTGGPSHHPTPSDTMASIYTEAHGQAQSTADSKGVDSVSMALLQRCCSCPAWTVCNSALAISKLALAVVKSILRLNWNGVTVVDEDLSCCSVCKQLLLRRHQA